MDDDKPPITPSLILSSIAYALKSEGAIKKIAGQYDTLLLATVDMELKNSTWAVVGVKKDVEEDKGWQVSVSSGFLEKTARHYHLGDDDVIGVFSSEARMISAVKRALGF
ncbi:hypothetical protein [Bifidobacterium rousetti]|uniref:hypothetical protein n=1 Tax=Bifidobacterium rousetti TaxID=2045439 RepID=UPI00123A7EE7|nr:hypothetical protein [Bifidobacterium rousetti]